ncbi:L,D-transpeptidase family protein [Flavobacterium luteum]|uniref:L,D-transpeptidase family protein n=1 Tax=Flavobacterium luteum TaxID=2026654 RepID=A0A7J5AIY9_9FLAO|nr:L,D-transpeptidase family protein [Flavobacterium luteum]KAB1157581.1 L,D-transpeptidase family protein [Flavobacterium luteum]
MKTLVKIILITIILIVGCYNSKGKKEDFFDDTGIYTTQYFTDLILKESDIIAFFKSYSEDKTIVNEVNLYYKNRNYQYAWFNKKGMTLAVLTFQNQLQNYIIDFQDNSIINKELDSLIVLIKNDKSISNLNENRVKKLELILTTTFFKYSKKVYSGIINNPYNLNWFIPRNKKNYQILLDSLVMSNNEKKAWEPPNQYYKKLKEKLKQYRIIEKRGGFPKIATTKKLLLFSESDSCLLKIKEYLFLSGDLKSNDNSIVFTDSLVKAVSQFQHRMGLPEDGKIGVSTIAELNKPIEFRIKQIMINMERLRWFPDEIESNFLIINIPEFKLHVFEKYIEIWNTKVVVGKEATKTSIFKGNISQIILNPYWNVPNSIIRNEMLPILKRNSSYLSKNNMEVLLGNKIINSYSINWKYYKKSIPFSIRQKPGVGNALGKIKFVFPNNFSIYLHDTPSKNLFNENKRAFSHGCIRVQEPRKLALYLLRNTENWNEEKVDTILKTNSLVTIPIKPTVAVYIVYFTAWVDDSGELNFRNDVYNLDKQLEKEIFD